jgi:hypothetical protein
MAEVDNGNLSASQKTQRNPKLDNKKPPPVPPGAAEQLQKPLPVPPPPAAAGNQNTSTPMKPKPPAAPNPRTSREPDAPKHVRSTSAGPTNSDSKGQRSNSVTGTPTKADDNFILQTPDPPQKEEKKKNSIWKSITSMFF